MTKETKTYHRCDSYRDDRDSERRYHDRSRKREHTSSRRRRRSSSSSVSPPNRFAKRRRHRSKERSKSRERTKSKERTTSKERSESKERTKSRNRSKSKERSKSKKRNRSKERRKRARSKERSSSREHRRSRSDKHRERSRSKGHTKSKKDSKTATKSLSLHEYRQILHHSTTLGSILKDYKPGDVDDLQPVEAHEEKIIPSPAPASPITNVETVSSLPIINVKNVINSQKEKKKPALSTLTTFDEFISLYDCSNETKVINTTSLLSVNDCEEELISDIKLPLPLLQAEEHKRQENIDISSRGSREGYPHVLNKSTRYIKTTGDWGHTLIQRYELLKKVGEGSYGQVYRARNSAGKSVALKRIQLEGQSEGFPITAVREIKILRHLYHPNIVELEDIVIYQEKEAKLHLKILMEYIENDLMGLIDAVRRKFIPNFDDNQIAAMTKQLLSGIEFCHSSNVIHRDLKPSNILVTHKGQLKIADWGLARLYEKDKDRLYTNNVITLWYRPPELLLGEERYGPPIDIWSVGCILAELFTKEPSFPGKTEQAVLLAIFKTCGTPTIHDWPEHTGLPFYTKMIVKTCSRILKELYKGLPKRALDLLDKMLILNPKKRLTASDALSHEWIKDLNTETVTEFSLKSDQHFHELWSKTHHKHRK